MCKYCFAAVFLVFLGLNVANAGGLKNVNEIRLSTENAMKKAQTDSFSDFFIAIKPFWIISEEGFAAALAKTSSARTEVHKKLGKSLGGEFVKSEMFSDSVMKIVYLEKFQKSAIVWNFYYYKPENEWYLSTFEWDDNIRALFQ